MSPFLNRLEFYRVEKSGTIGVPGVEPVRTFLATFAGRLLRPSADQAGSIEQTPTNDQQVTLECFWRPAFNDLMIGDVAVFQNDDWYVHNLEVHTPTFTNLVRITIGKEQRR